MAVQAFHKENKSEPNQELYRQWKGVFRSLPGFERCVCLRRVRCPNRRGDMDFFLINPAPGPKLGLVECEGFKGKAGKEKSIVPLGVEQLLNYLAGFLHYQNRGKAIFEDSIQDAFNEKKLRGRTNREQWSSQKEFMRAVDCKTESDLIRLLDRASRELIPILLYYRKTPLATREEEVLSLAFAKHRLYAGAVRWPEADKLLGGRYL